MKHLSNICDPDRADARRYHVFSDEQWHQYLLWVNRHIIGPPQATATYTVADLEQQGLVGVYAPGEED